MNDQEMDLIRTQLAMLELAGQVTRICVEYRELQIENDQLRTELEALRTRPVER